MRFVVAILLLTGACSYTAPGAAAGDDTPPDATVTGDAAGDTPDASSAASCSTLVPLGLVACYPLEDSMSGATYAFSDESGHGHDAAASGFVATTRDLPAPSQAATVTGSSSAMVPQSSSFDLVTGYTLSVWVRPDNPPGGNAGLLDHEGEWALSVNAGKASCWLNLDTGLAIVDTGTTVDNGNWQLLACTWNGQDLCASQIAAGGATVEQCQTVTGNPTPGFNGYSLGTFQNGTGPEEPFTGSIDDLRIYSRALSQTELCALIGRTLCPMIDVQQ